MNIQSKHTPSGSELRFATVLALYAALVAFANAQAARALFLFLFVTYGLRHRLSYITRWRGFKFTLSFGSQSPLPTPFYRTEAITASTKT